MKIFLPFILCLIISAPTTLHSQKITREQADIIARKYVQSKETAGYQVWTNADSPNEGVTITTWSGEKFA